MRVGVRLRDDSGATAVIVAILILVLVGMLASPWTAGSCGRSTAGSDGERCRGPGGGVLLCDRRRARRRRDRRGRHRRRERVRRRLDAARNLPAGMRGGGRSSHRLLRRGADTDVRTGDRGLLAEARRGPGDGVVGRRRRRLERRASDVVAGSPVRLRHPRRSGTGGRRVQVLLLVGQRNPQRHDGTDERGVGPGRSDHLGRRAVGSLRRQCQPERRGQLDHERLPGLAPHRPVARVRLPGSGFQGNALNNDIERRSARSCSSRSTTPSSRCNRAARCVGRTESMGRARSRSTPWSVSRRWR